MPANRTILNFDVDHLDTLRADINLDKTRLNSLLVLSEAGDQTDITFLHLFERIRDWAARDYAKETDTNTEGLEKRIIYMCDFMRTEVLGA